ncbi:MAG: tetratricopeptide repeat protein [Cytophagales bacterium]|nr:tetratricopeptide repeat protein [Cytophagales bacterium]
MQVLTTERILGFVREPTSLASSDVKEIDKVLLIYPYFQSFRILSTKGVICLGLPGIQKRLQKTSLSAVNRAFLKELLYKQNPLSNLITRDPKPKEQEQQKEPVQKTKTQHHKTDKIISKRDKDADKEAQQNDARKRLLEEAQDEIIRSVQASLEQARKSRAYYESLAPKRENIERTLKEIHDRISTPPPTNPDNPKKEPSKKKKKKKDADPEKNPTTNTEESPKTHEDLAASQGLPAEIVSETLAELLEKQGKKEKAIAMYRRLIILYPEKKDYFVTKIEKLLRS